MVTGAVTVFDRMRTKLFSFYGVQHQHYIIETIHTLPAENYSKIITLYSGVGGISIGY